MTLLDILTTCTSTLVALTLDTSTLLLAANASRKRLLILNVDQYDVWIHFGAGPAAEGGSWNLAGYLRRADGATEKRTFNALEEPANRRTYRGAAVGSRGQLWRGAVYGYIPSGGNGNVVVTEWT